MSASVKAYFALKMIGDPIDAPHMRRAREAILARGGAAHSNVFTRVLLALYGECRGAPCRSCRSRSCCCRAGFPFHLDKVSYWARTVLVPLLVLKALKPQARNPRGVAIDELFVEPPEAVRDWPQGAAPEMALVAALRRHRPCAAGGPSRMFPKRSRRRAIDKAVAFVDRAAERRGRARRHLPGDGQRGDDVRCAGLSAGSSATASTARASIDKLLVVKDDEAYCQPCLSPVWDTALAATR